MSPIIARPLTRRSLTALAILGACCIWLPEEMAFSLSVGVTGGLAASGYPLFLVAATLATCALLMAKMDMLRARRGLTRACALAQAAGTLGMVAASCALLPPEAFAPFAILGGAGFGIMSLTWGEFFADIPLRSIKQVMFGAAALQGVLSALSSLAPETDLAIALLPLASLPSLRVVSAETQAFGAEEARLPRASIRLPVLFSLGVAAMSVGRGCMVELSDGMGLLGGGMSTLLMTALSVGVLWALLFATKRLDYTPAWRVISTIMVTSFIALVSLGGRGAAGAAFATEFGYALFENIVWIASIDVAKYSVHAPVRFIAFTAVFTFGGQCLGALSTSLALFALGEGAMATIAGCGATLLVVAIIWLAPTEAVSQVFALAEGGAKEPADPANPAALFERFSLTARELEVAKLLASGRSARFIQENLGISESTAWTHIRHIYQKTGASNRQAFLTLVEELENAKDVPHH